ncbi:MAG TPA: hypothetical protein VF230_11730 [Acidimicrobiales bacterium]
MASEGMVGLYVETANYGATAAFWSSLGYRNTFETDHGSGQWQHPNGGPYVFIAERQGGSLETHPILAVADAAAFAPERAPDFAKPFTPEHWGVLEAVVVDPDGRHVSLQAPMPEGATAPDADAHHEATYG